MRGTRTRIVAAGAIAAAGAIVIAATAAVNNANVGGELSGYQEVPAVSTNAFGSVEAKVSDRGPIPYELTYRRMPDVTQAHLHFAQEAVNGGIVVFLCTNLGNGPEGTPECPDGRATLTGKVNAGDVVDSAAAQGIAAGEIDEVKAAIRAGAVYANVHSEEFPGGEIRAQLRTKK
jgi:CHRD domain